MTQSWILVLLAVAGLSSARPYAKLVPVLVPNDTLRYYVARHGGYSDTRDIYNPDRSPTVEATNLTPVYHSGANGGQVYWPSDEYHSNSISTPPTGGPNPTLPAPEVEAQQHPANADLAEDSSNSAYIGHQHSGWGWPAVSHHSHHNHDAKVYHYKVYPTKHHQHHGWQHYPFRHENQYYFGVNDVAHYGSWGWSFSNIYHQVLHKLEGYFGWKSWDFTGLTAILIATAFGVPLVLGLACLLFWLPIPILVNQLSARVEATKLFEDTTRLAKNILNSQQCVERISCEISTAAKKYDKTGIIKRLNQMLKQSSDKWANRISRGINSNPSSTKSLTDDHVISSEKVISSSACEVFECSSTERLLHLFNKKKKMP